MKKVKTIKNETINTILTQPKCGSNAVIIDNKNYCASSIKYCVYRNKFVYNCYTDSHMYECIYRFKKNYEVLK